MADSVSSISVSGNVYGKICLLLFVALPGCQKQQIQSDQDIQNLKFEIALEIAGEPDYDWVYGDTFNRLPTEDE